MTEIVHLGRCPTCNQPRTEVSRCRCSHLVTAHSFGTVKGATVRTYCTHSDCGCRRFEVAS